MASNYNSRLRPAEVLVDGADARVVRRRETFEQLFASELVDEPVGAPRDEEARS